MKKIIMLALLWPFISFPVFGREVLKLATTTSTYETGLLDYIIPPFEKKYNIQVQIISVGTGKAIKLGENGDADVILVHDRGAEDKFVSGGYGINRRDVMYNDFIILGPKEDPAGIAGLKSAESAFRKISGTASTFISRGDASGTDKKEKSLWVKAGVHPAGSWYLETGQGMSAALRLADEKNAYLLIDRGTYLFHKDSLRLAILAEGYDGLMNPYGVIAVNPKLHTHVRYDLAAALMQWFISEECQKMIDSFTVGGQRLFYANSAQ